MHDTEEIKWLGLTKNSEKTDGRLCDALDGAFSEHCLCDVHPKQKKGAGFQVVRYKSRGNMKSFKHEGLY